MRVGFVTGVLALSVIAMAARGAAADDVVMPYACKVSDGRLLLSPSAPATYAIIGARDERTHEGCNVDNAGRQVCTQLAVHRFAVQCDGGVVPWAQVAEATRTLGIAVPADLPAGYAPVTAVQARILLPAQARFTSIPSVAVTREALSPDGVLVNHDAAASEIEAAGVWSTVIKAEMTPEVPGRALRVGLAVGGVLGALFLLALAFTRQAREASPAFQGMGSSPFGRTAPSWQDWLARMQRGKQDSADVRASTSIMNAIAMATARLAEAELSVAQLAKDLGLRDVLRTELEAVRGRLEALERGLAGRPHEKSAATVRAILRDLERIGRIIDVASRDTSRDGVAAGREIALPETLQDAYDILGLNGDAAHNVAKKLVDALRMTWHPDFARDEQDRQQRESRMKQINAAWDLIKRQTAQAA